MRNRMHSVYIIPQPAPMHLSMLLGEGSGDEASTIIVEAKRWISILDLDVK